MENYESGRSMVEMLGVLAIIGVLSIGGIAGYTSAMNKYRSNEILNTASMLSVLARAANGGAGAAITSLNAAGLEPPFTGITMSAGTPDANGKVAITVSGLGTTYGKPCNSANAAANTSLFTITCN